MQRFSRIQVSIIRYVAGLIVVAPSAFGQQPGKSGIYRLYSPDKDWAIEVTLSDFAKPSEGVGDEPGTYHLSAFRARDGKPSFTSGLLDVYIEPAQRDGRKASIDELIADDVKSAKTSGDTVKLSEFNHIPVVRRSGESHDIYLSYNPAGSSASPFPGQSISSHPRHALEAYLMKNDRVIVIGFYASSLKSDDEKTFYSLLESVKLIDTSSPLTSFDNYSKGRAFFIVADYRKAAVLLLTSLNLEYKQRQLDLAQWRDLVEMAAIADGNSGDVAQAKKIFEYGIANDPDYPAYYLWLARYYTSANDLDNTIACLQKAFAGEEKIKDWAESSTFQQRDGNRRLPDPLTDPSFTKFSKDEKFRKAVKAMTKGHRTDIFDLIR